MPPEVDHEETQGTSRSTLKERLDRLAHRLRRTAAWANTHRLTAAVLAAAGLVSVGGLLAAGLILDSVRRAHQEANVTLAIEALDEGRYDDARQMAQTLREEPMPLLKTLAGTAFVLGAAAAAEAEASYAADKKHRYLVAAGYLDEARDRGFPAGREAEGLLLLAKSLYATGQYPQSRPILREALSRNPHLDTEIHRLLASAYLKDANPDYAKALEHNAHYLAGRMLLDHQRHEGLLERARILLHQQNLPECRSTLEEIPEQAGNQAEVMVLRARVLMHEADTIHAGEDTDRQADALEKYQAAVKMLRVAQSRDTLAAQVSGQAMYLIGVCLLHSGEDRAAWAQLSRTARTYPDTPEALAADYRLAGLAQQMGRDADALAAYRRVLGSVGDPRTYSNRWITLDELRGGVLQAYESYVEAEKFEVAVELAKLLYPTFSPLRTLELLAETYHAWGSSQRDAAAHLPPSQAEPLAREGREKLRRAGRTYYRLAKLRVTTRQYPEDLWASAENYLEGESFTRAAEAFQEYLKNESRRRRPRALLGLGEALLATGRVDESLEALRECIEYYPRDAATFRARLVASAAHAEQGRFDQARELLEENLDGDALTPASAEWRDSLFAVGRLLHAQGRYEEAAVRLEEAVDRYPDRPEAIEGRYLVGHCCLHSAKQAQAKLQNDAVPSTRTARAAEIRRLLSSALDRFQEAQQSLLDRQQTTELTSPERSMLRNCYFAIGGVLFDLGRYEEAVKTYLAIVGRYQDSPAVLEAYVQMARAYRRLKRPDEARGALEQAKVALERIPTQDQLADTSIFGKQQWSDLLDQLAMSGE